MSFRRPQPKRPGSPPLGEQQTLYIELVSKGLSNSAACRAVGVNRRTGTRWRRGRTIVNGAGETRSYPPIVGQPRRHHRYLSEAERLMIADGVGAGLTVRAIATVVGRSPSTISREIRRNRDPITSRYMPRSAHRQALQRRRRPKAGKIAANNQLRRFVQEHLDRRWSPQQIAGALPYRVRRPARHAGLP